MENIQALFSMGFLAGLIVSLIIMCIFGIIKINNSERNKDGQRAD